MNFLPRLSRQSSFILCHLGCILTSIIAITALCGWIFDIPVLRSYGTDIKPLSPISGLIFIAMSALLFNITGASTGMKVVRSHRITVLLLILLSVFFLCAIITFFKFSIISRYTSIDDMIQSAPLMSMSPLTACCFFLCGILLFMKAIPFGRDSTVYLTHFIISGVVSSSGMIIVIFYFLGGPLFYKQGIIPPSLPSSLAFIFFGAALFSSVRFHGETRQTIREASPLDDRRPLYILLSLSILLSLGIMTAGYFYFVNYRSNYMATTGKMLSTIVNMKSDGLVRWRNARLGDASSISKNQSFIGLVRNQLDNPSDTATDHLIGSWLENLRESYPYRIIYLTDTAGYPVKLLRDTTNPEITAIHSEDIALVKERHRAVMFDLHRDTPDAFVHMTIISPVFDDVHRGRLLGFVAFKVNPSTFLYPYLEEWPSTDTSAEVLLVRREGSDVLFLNRLKYNEYAGLNFRIPLSRHTLPAAMAVQGKTGVVQGHDYRNVPVIAAIRSIPDSPWFLVARIDKSEIEAPLRKHLWMTTGIIVLLLCAFSTGVGAIWLYRKSRFYREKFLITEALARSEVLLRTIFDNVNDGIAAVDMATIKCITANNALFSLFGCVKGDPATLIIKNHLSPDNYSALFGRTASGQAGIHLIEDMQVKQHDGSVIFTDLSTVPVRIDGKDCLLCVFRDITERKRANEKIDYHEELLNQIGKMAKIGGWEFDTASGEGSWTEEVALIHDLDPADPTSRDIGLSFYTGESRARIMNAIDDAISGGNGYDLELELVTAKGTKKWIRSIGQPLLKNGKVVKLRGSFQDITDLKETEFRISHLNNVLQGIRNINKSITHEKNRDDLMQQICNQFVEARGFHSAAIVLTKEKNGEIDAVFVAGEGSAVDHPVLGARVLEEYQRNTFGESTIIIMQDQNDTYDKSLDSENIPEKLMLQIIHDERMFGFLLVTLPIDIRTDCEEQNLLKESASDIAFALHSLEIEEEHIQSAKALANSEQQLRQSQKLEAVGQLAGGIAHDFNNIISAILGYCDLISEDLSGETLVMHNMRQIIKCSERAAGLTRQLLAFSRKQISIPVVMNLNTTISNIEDMLRRLIGEDIELRLHLHPEIAPVEADPNQIEQIILNLCVNSRDAMSSGGKLTIETSNQMLDEKYCMAHMDITSGTYSMLAISDTGCGMDESVREKLFEPFFTTKERGKGTGLGLSTVYGIVKQSQGHIWCYSEPGKGTTFKIYFPQATAAIGYEAKTVPIDVRIPAGFETVLLAEDEKDVRDVASAILRNAGYRVMVATDGTEALEIGTTYTDTIHLLVTDVVMPGMSGKQLAESLTKIHHETKVIYTSGYTDNVIIHHGILERNIHFLQKPYNKQLLLAKVRDVLDTKPLPDLFDILSDEHMRV